MEELVGAVQRVKDIMSEISTATAEQSDGIAQVNLAITQLDQVTQQNAALVEESTAAAESLREQARTLTDAVGTSASGNAEKRRPGAAGLGRPGARPANTRCAVAPRP
jgi:uncharacterized phage infection (PIP) family protein YhgE